MTPPLARRKPEEYRDVLEACHRLGIEPTDVVTTRAWLTIARRLDALEDLVVSEGRRADRVLADLEAVVHAHLDAKGGHRGR